MRRRQIYYGWIAALLVFAALTRFGSLVEIPPAVFHDEAYNGLDAMAMLEGRRFPIFHDTWEVYADQIHQDRPASISRFPVFFEGNYGREPLYVYLLAASFGLLGISDWSLRLVSAVGGLLVVCFSVPLVRHLLEEGNAPTGRVVLFSLLAACGAYPLLAFSRLGFRAIWFVLFQGISVVTFWRAWIGNQARQWRVAGFAMGLLQYTYGAARLLPIAIATFFLIRLVVTGGTAKKRFKGLSIMATVTLIVIVPLISFFLRYPDYLTLRARVVAVDEPGSGFRFWLQNAWRALLGLFWHGDVNPLLNLPRRPFLDPFQASLALLGVGVIISRPRRPLTSFVLVWLAAMLIPSVLVGSAPHFGRSLGVAYPLVLLIVIGANLIWGWLADYSLPIADGVVFSVLIISMLHSSYDYFLEYPRTPNLYHEFKAHLADVGRFARRLPEETTLYLTPPQKYYAGILFELRDESRIEDFYGPAGALPAGIAGYPSTYLVMAEDQTTGEVLEDTFDSGQWLTTTTNFAAYSVPATEELTPGQTIQARFDDVIVLLGADVREHREGSVLDVTLYWRALDNPETPYTAFVHLVDQEGDLVAQIDRPPHYTTDRWRRDELVLDTYTIELSDPLPQRATYRLLTGFYNDSVVRLPVIQNGEKRPDHTVLVMTMETP